MRFHYASRDEVPGGQSGAAKLHTLGAEDDCGIFRASCEQGLIVAVRPDGCIGMVAGLDGVQVVIDYLDSVIVRQR